MKGCAEHAFLVNSLKAQSKPGVAGTGLGYTETSCVTVIRQRVLLLSQPILAPEMHRTTLQSLEFFSFMPCSRIGLRY